MDNAIDFVLPQRAGVLSDYNAPDWEYGGGKPVKYTSADGTLFWGTLEKQGGSSGPLKLIVYHTSSDARTLIGTWADSGIVGQGGLVLQPDGTLEAQGYIAFGDNATMRAVPVPGWKAWPTANVDTTARTAAAAAQSTAQQALSSAASASAQASAASTDAAAALAAASSAGGGGASLSAGDREAINRTKAWLGITEEQTQRSPRSRY